MRKDDYLKLFDVAQEALSLLKNPDAVPEFRRDRIIRDLEQTLDESIKTKCSPHNWRMPEVGDQRLECLRCGRKLEFMELNPNLRASIANAHGDEFRDAFHQSFDAWQKSITPTATANHPYQQNKQDLPPFRKRKSAADLLRGR